MTLARFELPSPASEASALTTRPTGILGQYRHQNLSSRRQGNLLQSTPVNSYAENSDPPLIRTYSSPQFRDEQSEIIRLIRNPLYSYKFIQSPAIRLSHAKRQNGLSPAFTMPLPFVSFHYVPLVFTFICRLSPRLFCQSIDLFINIGTFDWLFSKSLLSQSKALIDTCI